MIVTVLSYLLLALAAFLGGWLWHGSRLRLVTCDSLGGTDESLTLGQVAVSWRSIPRRIRIDSLGVRLEGDAEVMEELGERLIRSAVKANAAGTIQWGPNPAADSPEEQLWRDWRFAGKWLIPTAIRNRVLAQAAQRRHEQAIIEAAHDLSADYEFRLKLLARAVKEAREQSVLDERQTERLVSEIECHAFLITACLRQLAFLDPEGEEAAFLAKVDAHESEAREGLN